MIRVLDSAGSTLVEWGRQQQQHGYNEYDNYEDDCYNDYDDMTMMMMVKVVYFYVMRRVLRIRHSVICMFRRPTYSSMPVYFYPLFQNVNLVIFMVFVGWKISQCSPFGSFANSHSSTG